MGFDNHIGFDNQLGPGGGPREGVVGMVIRVRVWWW